MPGEMPSTPDAHTLHVQQLFVRHQQAVLAYVLSLEPNLADAQDIVQEVSLTISRKAGTWTRDTDFLAWVCTVARYDVLHFQRTRARRVARLDEDVFELLHDGGSIDESVFQQHVTSLQRCLEWLAPRSRELVWMRYQGARMSETSAWSVRPFQKISSPVAARTSASAAAFSSWSDMPHAWCQCAAARLAP
jgi:RNA polymerase sigma-70 factor (ECF subfamily)